MASPTPPVATPAVAPSISKAVPTPAVASGTNGKKLVLLVLFVVAAVGGFAKIASLARSNKPSQPPTTATQQAPASSRASLAAPAPSGLWVPANGLSVPMKSGQQADGFVVGFYGSGYAVRCVYDDGKVVEIGPTELCDLKNLDYQQLHDRTGTGRYVQFADAKK